MAIHGLLVQAKDQRSVARQGTWSVQSSEGREGLKARGHQGICYSFDIRVICSTRDDVGLFLVVHLQHIIFGFHRSIEGEK